MIAKALLIASCLLCCAGQEPIPVKAVRGTPFSATATTESVQVLADGNRIVRTTSANIARDAEGRTRREQNGIVYLQDPVAGLAYVLDTQAKSVRQIPIRQAGAADQPREAVALGSQSISGFVAEGSRLTKVIPPGEMGNERSFEIVSETWFSQRLETILQHRTLDPRRGQVEYRLTDIQLRDPDPELFRVPNE